MHLTAAAVSLDEVAHLENLARVPVYQAGSPLDQARAAVPPHLPVPGELGPLHAVEPLRGLIIVGMIDIRRFRIEMRVAEDDDIVGIVFLAPSHRLRGQGS